MSKEVPTVQLYAVLVEEEGLPHTRVRYRCELYLKAGEEWFKVAGYSHKFYKITGDKCIANVDIPVKLQEVSLKATSPKKNVFTLQETSE